MFYFHFVIVVVVVVFIHTHLNTQTLNLIGQQNFKMEPFYLKSMSINLCTQRAHTHTLLKCNATIMTLEWRTFRVHLRWIWFRKEIIIFSNSIGITGVQVVFVLLLLALTQLVFINYTVCCSNQYKCIHFGWILKKTGTKGYLPFTKKPTH